MINLEDFLYKNVVVVDIYGVEHFGYVDMYCSADDDPDDPEESIGLVTDENSKLGIGLFRSEIKSISTVD
ncbi:MAG: hypothetical protein NC395_07245 [Prevotella sp.]|nr:hypothetical protein [Prevotella sp.]